MFERYYKLPNELVTSIFLFGARQTGKTTLLLQQFPQAEYIDLLDTLTLAQYSRRPALLYERYKNHDSNTIVIIDEIQQVPLLLNEVHRLITQKGIHFILCGSSARKLRRKGYNTLGGRALPCYLYPLVSAEIPDFNIDKALNNVGRKYIRNAMSLGTKLSKDSVNRINDMFKDGKLDKVEAIGVKE